MYGVDNILQESANQLIWESVKFTVSNGEEVINLLKKIFFKYIATKYAKTQYCYSMRSFWPRC